MKPPDSRGWFSLGLFGLTTLVLGMLAHDPKLADNHLFATLAQAVVITGLINLAAGYEFGASRSAGKSSPPDADASPS